MNKTDRQTDRHTDTTHTHTHAQRDTIKTITTAALLVTQKIHTDVLKSFIHNLPISLPTQTHVKQRDNDIPLQVLRENVFDNAATELASLQNSLPNTGCT